MAASEAEAEAEIVCLCVYACAHKHTHRQHVRGECVHLCGVPAAAQVGRRVAEFHDVRTKIKSSFGFLFFRGGGRDVGVPEQHECRTAARSM